MLARAEIVAHALTRPHQSGSSCAGTQSEQGRSIGDTDAVDRRNSHQRCVLGVQTVKRIPQLGAQCVRRDGFDCFLLGVTGISTLDGELAVVMQRQNMTEGFDWRAMYGASELAMVTVLEDAGFSGQMLNILGYDGDIPVWSGVDDEQRQCLMVVQGAEVVQQCGGPARIEPLELTIGDTTYAIEQTPDRGDALTIYRGTGVQG